MAHLPGDSWTFLDRTVRTGRLLGADVVVVGERRPTRWNDVIWVDDLWPGDGPLGGAISGLNQVTTVLALLLAVDQPGLLAEDIANLIESVGSHPVAYAIGGQIATFPVAFPVQPTLERLIEQWKSGERSLLRALISSGLTTADVTGERIWRLRDFDRPEELHDSDEVTEG